MLCRAKATPRAASAAAPRAALPVVALRRSAVATLSIKAAPQPLARHAAPARAYATTPSGNVTEVRSRRAITLCV